MKLFSKIIVVLLFAIIFIAGTKLVDAQAIQQLELPKTSINPGSFYYPFKRLLEKGKERVIFSREGKISFYKSLLKIRLSELNYVVNKKFLSEVQGSSERFSFTVGILTEELIEQNKAEEKQNLINEFKSYSQFLDILRDKFPANSSFWMLVQHDINTLNILTGRLK